MCAPALTIPTNITEALILLLNYSDRYSEITAYTALANSYWLVTMTHTDAKATPTNDTNYSCHIKAIELTYITQSYGSISHHIMSLVINSLRVDTYNVHTKTILRNQMSDNCRPALAGL